MCCRRLAPDLILTQDLCDVCAVSYRTVNDAVRVMDLDTRVVSLQPGTIAEILTTIRTVGDLIDASDAAERVCADAAAPPRRATRTARRRAAACCSSSGSIR